MFLAKPRKRVGLFGGSFNPPHVGHTAICKWLFARGLVEELWIIPCFQHPLGKGVVPFEHRFEMAKLAFGKIMLPIRILDVESKLGGTSHTLRTIEHLKADYPHFRFSLVTGGDIKGEFDMWHEAEKIKELVDIIEIPRGANSFIPNVSSTEIREKLLNGKAFAQLVETEVAVYIITRGLYRAETS